MMLTFSSFRSCDGRVVKAFDSKSNGVSPRRFESCSQRRGFKAYALTFDAKVAITSMTKPWNNCRWDWAITNQTSGSPKTYPCWTFLVVLVPRWGTVTRRFATSFADRFNHSNYVANFNKTPLFYQVASWARQQSLSPVMVHWTRGVSLWKSYQKWGSNPRGHTSIGS